MALCWGLAHTPGPRGRGLTEIELHEAEGWSEVLQATPLALVKCLESRKRVTLGRKRFWSRGDLEALIFTESGQVYMQEDGSGRERPRKAMAKGWPGGGGVGQGLVGWGWGGAGAESRPQSWEGVGLCYPFHPVPRAFWRPPRHRSSQPTVVRRAPREPVVLSPQGKCTFLCVRGVDQSVNMLWVQGLCVVAVMCVNIHALKAPFPELWAPAVSLRAVGGQGWPGYSCPLVPAGSCPSPCCRTGFQCRSHSLTGTDDALGS